MALMRVRDKDGNIKPILAIKGEKGDSAYQIAQTNGFEICFFYSLFIFFVII